MSKYNAGIRSGLEFKTAELAWVDEVVESNSELKSLNDYFFNKFSKSVEKHDQAECFRIIIRWLVWFGDHDCSRYLEVFRPVA